MDEFENLEKIFLNLNKQNFSNFSVYFCINQPKSWWDKEEQIHICNNNLKSIDFINKIKNNYKFQIHLIDRSSKEKAWSEKNQGVGWARKTLMDYISNISNENDIIISLDADTQYDSNYFQLISEYFQKNTSIDCISIPYYHPLNTDDNANKAILRYEIYMRYYLLNLFRINNPYSFSALGSAIAFRISSLNKIGGFSPKKSGEDFYFLQKMVKYKGIGIWLNSKVYPEARFSNRVFFGTGPAMIKGNTGDWNSYPIYSMTLFDKIKEFFNLAPTLFKNNIETPLDSFFKSIEERNQLFDKLRKNNKDIEHFVKALYDYFDGLRILQFLKQNNEIGNDNINLQLFLRQYGNTEINDLIKDNFKLENSSIIELNEIRDYLCKLEDLKRKEIFYSTWKTN